MRYVVVGCGAIGGTVAAGLVRDGHDVLVADADSRVVNAVNSAGISITGPVENFTVPASAVSPADLPERLDCPVLIAVKAHHTASAADSVAGRLTGDSYVLSLQNGLNTTILEEKLGATRVVEACVNFGADAIEPGTILRGNRATFMVGEPDGTITGRVEALAADLADATVTDNVLGYIWAKEAYGAMLAAGAVSDLPIADTLDDPAYRELMLEVARQVLAQAPVTAMPLDGFDPSDLDGSLARLAEFNRGSAKTHSGIYRDLAVLHRPTEVAAILGGLAGPGAPLIGRIIDLIAAIERGSRVCERANLDLLAAYERLDRLGPPLNAVAAVISAPDRAASGPLAGEPVAVKDIVEIAGVPTRCGSPASDDAPARKDAEIVSRLRAAGAEVFAASQCLEYAAGFAHPEVGDTRNPRDPSRTSGGSSGGSAALVAAGVCDLAIGTDTGGSIRIPASYCGIVGLKPSYGLVPVDGIFPLSPACDHAGTLTAHVLGTVRLLAVLAGRSAPDLGDYAGSGHFTVGVLSAQLADSSVTAPVADAIRAALAALADAGWELREVTGSWLDQLRRWEQTLGVIVSYEGFQAHAGRDTSRYSDGTRALLELGASVTGAELATARAEQAELTAAIEASLSGVDALAGPSVGYVAPAEDPPFGLGDDNGEGRFSGPYNLSGHPALSMPVPAPGLPVGLQLAGRRGADFELLRVAAAAERVFTRA
ncbi:MAG TPA: amidase family protein [Streptosporangiaceae bacterium]|nr:amidase family protein [Streptosporangiaceae bacterium]